MGESEAEDKARVGKGGLAIVDESVRFNILALRDTVSSFFSGQQPDLTWVQ